MWWPWAQPNCSSLCCHHPCPFGKPPAPSPLRSWGTKSGGREWGRDLPWPLLRYWRANPQWEVVGGLQSCSAARWSESNRRATASRGCSRLQDITLPSQAFVLCILLMEILFFFGQNNSGLRTELHVEASNKGTRYPSWCFCTLKFPLEENELFLGCLEKPTVAFDVDTCSSGGSFNNKAQAMLTSAAGSSADGCWHHLFPPHRFSCRPRSYFSSQWGVVWCRLPHGKGFGGGCSKRAMTFTGHFRRWSFSLATCTLKIVRRAVRTPRSPPDQPRCPRGALGSSADLLARSAPLKREVKPPGIDPHCRAGEGGIRQEKAVAWLCRRRGRWGRVKSWSGAAGSGRYELPGVQN